MCPVLIHVGLYHWKARAVPLPLQADTPELLEVRAAVQPADDGPRRFLFTGWADDRLSNLRFRRIKSKQRKHLKRE